MDEILKTVNDIISFTIGSNSFFVEIINAEMTLEQTKLWCLGMIKTHKIQPGRSFGDLPITKHYE
jgi:hypothetical protein